MVQEADAVVVGAGPNGLVAAIALGDAGWDVVVVEAHDEVGGAVSSAEVLAPGYVTDLFSAFYPLAAASPVLTGMRLEDHGLRWSHAPHVLAHPLTDGRCVVLDRRIDVTAELPAHFTESMETLGFDLALGDLPLDEVKFSETPEGKRRAASAAAKARRKERKGERRGRGRG